MLLFHRLNFALIAAAFLTAASSIQAQQDGPEFDADAAEAQYQQYCALCHGADREGYANDNAPALHNASIYDLSAIVPYLTISYGRPGTPMGPYLDEMSGPLSKREIDRLAVWLSLQAGVEPEQPSDEDLEPVTGDVESGAKVYQENCAHCHGTNGEGGEGTALGNPAMLAITPDRFLRQAIAEGRDGTPMPAFAGQLSDIEIDSVTAFLRSRAAGWDVGPNVRVEPPAPENYVLNANGDAPQFDLQDGIYVLASDLYRAIAEKRKMILLDTRVPYFWAMAHIGGSIPLPYYSDFDAVLNSLPKDGTWIVAYCECPRAAAKSVVGQLRARGYKNTAVLWEGYAGWTALGYPVSVGKVTD